MRQALDVRTQPVIWSHSSVTRTRTPNWKMPVWQARQLSFDTAKLIADKGGVVGLWPMRSDVGATPEAYAQRLWELGEWLGDDHAAFGTDMNAISRPAIASYADLQKVVRYWQKAGFPAASIQKLAIGNYARVLQARHDRSRGLGTHLCHPGTCCRDPACVWFGARGWMDPGDKPRDDILVAPAQRMNLERSVFLARSPMRSLT